MDLRNNQDDRPYRGVNRSGYNTPSQYDYGYDDETMTTQAYYRARIRNLTEQRWFPLAAVTLGVIVFGSLIAFAYNQGAGNTANSTTPLIQAENGSYKEKPQDPGGMDVPFQDAVVFDQLDKSKTADANEKVENLLPPPEQPVEEAKTATTTTTAENAADKAERAVEAAPPSAPKENTDKSVIADATATGDDSVADKIAATEANMKAKADKVETVETVADAKPVEATKTDTAKTETTKSIPLKNAAATATATKAATTTTTAKATTMDDVVKSTTTASASPAKMNAVSPAATTPAPAKTGGTAKVQLGAFKDEAAARTAWTQFQKTYAPHLNGVTPNYARADLGAKGVFYRVQGVNLSKTQAQDICKSINATKAGACIIAQ